MAVTILQIVPRLVSGGSELTTVEITQALTRAGARAIVASEGGRMETAIRRAGGGIVRIPVASKNPVTMLTNVGRLKHLIETHQIDLIHVRSRAPAWSAFFAARSWGRPFVTTYHGAYGEGGPLKAMYNSIMGRGDRVIANSSYTADLIASRQTIARERIRVIYRGVNGALFNPSVVPRGAVERLRKNWGVVPGVKIVLHAARLTRLKGQCELIAAAAHLNKQAALEGAVVILAGEAQDKSAYRQELLDLISYHDLNDKVRLVGHCENMAVAFLAAYVAVMPSRVAETFGRTSVEAQAMGCPVIVSRLGALPETIVAAEHDQTRFTGWLVAPRNSTVLSERIRLALSLTPSERAVIGARGRAYVAAKFDLTHMQKATLSVYDELLDSNLAEVFGNRTVLS
jgi:glycosyltransferase involved in cell wall biosynthesis